MEDDFRRRTAWVTTQSGTLAFCCVSFIYMSDREVTTRWKHKFWKWQKNIRSSRLTPSKDVVPEELLFPNKHGHYDERVKIDAFT